MQWFFSARLASRRPAKSNTAFTSIKTRGQGDGLVEMAVTDPATATGPLLKRHGVWLED